MFLVPLAICAAVLLLTCFVAAAVWVTWTVSAEKWRFKLNTATAKLANMEDDGTHTLMESFTMGWLNVLFQHTWTPILEKHLSHLAAGVLQRVLNAVLREHGSRAPLKYLENVTVEEVTFGLVPPSFQLCFAKYDPRKNILHLSMNLRFNSSGFQAVLCPRMKQIGRLKSFEFRVEITHLMLAGRLNLALHLTKEAPGVSKMDYSFANEPELDLKFRPVGLGVGEVPVVVTALRRQLQRVIYRQLVEPRRRTLDVKRIYNNRHILKAGGPGGLLRVVLLGVTGLTPQSGAQTQEANGITTSIPPFSMRDMYVEVKFGQELYRTPIARDMSWNWQVDMPLLAELGCHASQDKLRFEVLSARTVGDPDRVAIGKLSLLDTRLHPNSEPCLLNVPLKSPVPSITPVLQMTMNLLKAVLSPDSPTAAPKIPAGAPTDPKAHSNHNSHTHLSSVTAELTVAVPATGASYHTPGAHASASHLPASHPSGNPSSLHPPAAGMSAPLLGMSSAPVHVVTPANQRGSNMSFGGNIEVPPPGGNLSPLAAGEPALGCVKRFDAFTRHSMGPIVGGDGSKGGSGSPLGSWSQRLRQTASMLSMSAAAPSGQDMRPVRCSSWDQQVAEGHTRVQGAGPHQHSSRSSQEQGDDRGDHKRSVSEGGQLSLLGRLLGNGVANPEPPGSSSPYNAKSRTEGSVSPLSMDTQSDCSPARSMSPHHSSPRTAFEVEQKGLDSWRKDMHDHRHNAFPSDGNLGAFPMLRHTDSIVAEVYPNFNAVPASRVSSQFGSMQNALTPSSNNPLQTLVQVSKLQRLLEQEQGAAAMLQEEVAALHTRLKALERKRLAEGRRALVEGARFEVWLPGSYHPKSLTVWFSVTSLCLRLAENKATDPKRSGNGSPKRAGGTEKPTENGHSHSHSNGWKALSAKHLVRVQLGNSLFPSEPHGVYALGLKMPWSKKTSGGNCVNTGPASTGAATAAVPPVNNGNELRCLTLVLLDEQCIHLQLPANGNGRSREEWAAAFTDLAMEFGQASSNSLTPEISLGSHEATGLRHPSQNAEASDSSAGAMGPTSQYNSDSSSPLMPSGLSRIKTGRQGSNFSLDGQGPTQQQPVFWGPDRGLLRRKKMSVGSVA